MRIKVGATIIIIIMRNQEKIRSKAVSLFQSYIFSTCVDNSSCCHCCSHGINYHDC